MTTIYLVRHMETEANVSRHLQGQSDTAPSETGLMQLKWLGERFDNISIDKIYTSPLNRAKITAQAVRGGRNISIVEDKRLMEIDLGDMENTYIPTMETTHPEQFVSINSKLHTLSAPNGENVEQVHARMSKVLNDIVKNNNGKTVVIVSHGLAIQACSCGLHGKDHTYIDNIPLGQNTSVTKATYGSDGTYTICYMNDVEHIPEEFRKSHKKYLASK